MAKKLLFNKSVFIKRSVIPLLLFALFALQSNVVAQTCTATEYLLNVSGNADDFIIDAGSANVTDPVNAVGDPTSDFLYAKIDKLLAEPEYLILDLTDIIPTGSTIQIHWGTDNANPATIKIEESISSTSTSFLNTQTYSTTGAEIGAMTNSSQHLIASFTTSADTRYLKIYQLVAGKPGILGVSYSFNVCESAIPVAVNDDVNVNDDVSINIDVQANDSDPQSLPLTTSLTLISGPSNGTAIVQGDGTITYTPNNTFTGSDTFTYEVCNAYSTGLCDTATVTVTGCTVEEYFDVSDTGNALSVFAENAIGNSGFALGDPTASATFSKIDNDTDFLVLALDQAINPGDKVIIYWAADDGNEAFLEVEESADGTNFSNVQSYNTTTIDPLFITSEYIVTSSTEYLRFTRTSGSAGKPMIMGLIYEIYSCLSAYPVAVDDNVQTGVSTLVNIDVQNNDSDPQSLPLTTSLALVSGPTNGTATVLGDGTIDYTPTTGYAGPDSFTYEICNAYKGGLCETATVNIFVGASELEITKTVNVSIPSEGQQITYTITVTNNGPDDASGVVVNDDLPVGVTYFNNNTVSGSYNFGDGNWTIGAIPASGSVVLEIIADVDVGQLDNTITNTATITNVDQIDNNATNDTDSVAITIKNIDLAITKTVTAAPYNEGQDLTYTVNIANNGPSDATGILVEDALAAVLTFVSATPDQGTYNSGTGIWDVGALASGQNRDLVIVVQPNTGTSGTAINNVAILNDSDQTDTNATNNSASVEIEVAKVDLLVEKTVNDVTPDEGQLVTFSVKLTNLSAGNSLSSDLTLGDATGIVIEDILPAGLTFVAFTQTPNNSSGSATTATETGGVITWNVADLVNNSNITLKFTATVDANYAAQTILNTAEITDIDQVDAYRDNNESIEELFVNGADIEVVKTVNNVAPNPGETIIYTVQIKNNGHIDATNVVITDILPAGVTYVSDSSGGTALNPGGGVYDAVTPSNLLGTWEWTIGNVGVYVDITDLEILTITATVDAGTIGSSIINTASVSGVTQPDSITDNNSDTALIAIGEADLGVTKVVITTPTDGIAYDPLDTVSYLITIENYGPNNAPLVEVNDLLPSTLTFVSATPSVGTYNDVTGIWTVGDLIFTPTPITQTLTITATINAGTETAGQTITNIATVSSPMNEPVAATVSNTDSDSIQVHGVDLSVTKTVNSQATYEEGDQITYTVTVTNNGPDDVGLDGTSRGVEVTDLFPLTLEIVSTSVVASSVSDNAGTYTALPTGQWTGITLTSGESATLTVVANIESGGGINNIATITHTGNQSDSNTANNTSSVFISALKTFTAGSAIINMGSTIGSVLDNDQISAGILPSYGLIHELITVGKVPVWWSINPDKSFVNTTGTLKEDQIDFTLAEVLVDPVFPSVFTDPITGTTVNNVEYRSGAFIIDAVFLGFFPQEYDASGNPVGIPVKRPAQILLENWLAANPGVRVDFATDSFQAPIHEQLTSFSRAVLDSANGGLAESFFWDNTGLTNAIIGTDSFGDPIYDLYRPDGTPENLDECDDIYTMPHADPHAWTELERKTYYDFVTSGGWIWLACHAVSSQETLVDMSFPAGGVPPDDYLAGGGDGAPDMNFLSNAGLIPWGDHGDGTLPYEYNVDTGIYANNLASDPFMQFIGTIDGSLLSGSESIYIPYAEGWRDSTVIGVYDPDHPEIAAGTSHPSNAAALVAYGYAFGDPSMGMVVYEASHSVTGGTEQEEVGAARIYGNFWLQAGVDFRPEITPTLIPEAIVIGETETFSVNIESKQGYTTDQFTIQWVSSCGGTFSNPNGLTTEFTPTLNVIEPTVCIVRLIIEDPCGRQNFLAESYLVYPLADIGIEKTIVTPDPVPAVGDWPIAGETIQYELEVTNYGDFIAYDAQVEDILPAGLSFVSFTAVDKDNIDITSTITYDPVTSIYYLGDVESTFATGAFEKVIITTTVQIAPSVADNTSITNTASVTTLSNDQNLDNNTDFDETIVYRRADLSLTKVVDNATPNVGGDVVFTIEVTNGGPSDSSGFTTVDDLSDGYAYQSHSGDGTYDDGSGLWNFGVLTPGQSATLNITAEVLPNASPSDYSNYAEITVATEVDPDSTPNNGSTTDEDDEAIVTVTPVPVVDLAIDKVFIKAIKDNTSGTNNPLIEYYITVENLGPSDATGVTISDTPDLTSNFQSGGIYQYSLTGLAASWTTYAAGPPFVYSVGNLAAGASFTLYFRGESSSGTVTNKEFINTSTTDSNEGDPASDNNIVIVTTEPSSEADLVTVKTLTSADVTQNIGDIVTFLITVTNNGPDEATGVNLNDVIPSGLTATVNNGTVSQGTYISPLWTIGTLANGASATLTIEGTVNSDQAGNTVTNTTTKAEGNQPDPSDVGNDLTESVDVCGSFFMVATENHLSCIDGLNDGSIDISVVGGTAPYDFLWSNGAITEDISGLAAGDYTVTVTDALGCENSATYTIGVIENPYAALLITGTQGSTTIPSFEGPTGSFPPDGVDGGEPGYYGVTFPTTAETFNATFNNYYIPEDYIIDPDWDGTIAVNYTQNHAGTESNSSFAAGSRITEFSDFGTGSGNASGNDYYVYGRGTWSFNTTGFSEGWTVTYDFASLSNGYLPAGTMIAFTDIDGFDDGEETAELTAVLDSGATTAWATYFDNSTQSPAQSSPTYVSGTNSYEWDVLPLDTNNGNYVLETTENLTSITVNATNLGGGSIGLKLAAPIVPIDVTLTGSTPTYCSSDPPNGTINVVIAGNVGPYTIDWDNGAGNSGSVASQASPYTITGLEGGTYTVTVGAGTLGTSCIVSETVDVTVTEQAPPNAGSDGTLTICGGTTPTDAELFAALGGNPFLGGTWTNVGLVYTYTVSAIAPCTQVDETATVTLIEQAPPVAEPVVGATEICFDETTTFTSGGTAGGFWSSSNHDIATIDAAGIVTAVTTGTVTITYNVFATDPCSANATASRELMIHELPFLNVTDVSCAPDLATYTIAFTSNGVVTTTAGTVSGNSVIDIPAGTNVTLTSLLNGCTTDVDITAPDCSCPIITPAVSGGDRTYCEGETIPTLVATTEGNISVDWYDLSTGGSLLLSGSNVYTPTGAGIYYAEAINLISGCTATPRTAVTLTQFNAPILSPQSQTICSGDTAGTISTTENMTWTSDLFGLTNSGTTIDAGVLINKGSEPYTITFTAVTGNGCEDTATITVNPEPQVSASTYFIVCNYDPVDFNLNSTLAGTVINWELTDDLTPSIVIESGTGTDSLAISKDGLTAGNYTYTFTGTNNGCTSEPFEVIVTVNE